MLTFGLEPTRIYSGVTFQAVRPPYRNTPWYGLTVRYSARIQIRLTAYQSGPGQNKVLKRAWLAYQKDKPPGSMQKKFC